MGKLIPKTDPDSQKFWDSVAKVAAEVKRWPAWKRGASPYDLCARAIERAHKKGKP